MVRNLDFQLKRDRLKLSAVRNSISPDCDRSTATWTAWYTIVPRMGRSFWISCCGALRQLLHPLSKKADAVEILNDDACSKNIGKIMEPIVGAEPALFIVRLTIRNLGRCREWALFRRSGKVLVVPHVPPI